MIISFLNQKGGVGKTTLAVHVASALSRRKGVRVVLIDADQQGSALDWGASREEPTFPVIGLPKPSLHKEVKTFGEDYTHIVIDGPPRVYDVARSAMLASDVLLIPIQPSPYDIWAAEETVNLIKEASVFKENLKSAFVISRKIVNTAIGRDVVEALSQYPFPVLAAEICQRVVFAESAGEGHTVLNSRDSAAIKEITSLVDEILEFGK